MSQTQHWWNILWDSSLTIHVLLTYHSRQNHCTGCLQIQPNIFPGDFQDTFNVPAGFLHWSSLLSITTQDTNTCTFSYVWHYEKIAQKNVKWQFLRFKDVTWFGSVVGILSYFSWQLNFPAASIKFPEISQISRSDFKFQGDFQDFQKL